MIAGATEYWEVNQKPNGIQEETSDTESSLSDNQ